MAELFVSAVQAHIADPDTVETSYRHHTYLINALLRRCYCFGLVSAIGGLELMFAAIRYGPVLIQVANHWPTPAPVVNKKLRYEHLKLVR
jgi:hypothetical protein